MVNKEHLKMAMKKAEGTKEQKSKEEDMDVIRIAIALGGK